MITSDTNFRGNFDSIEAVWEAIPYGGVEGDYLNIQGVKYRWNKYLAMWENAEVVTETPARETVTFDEDVNMQNNLTVAGVLRAKKFVVDDLPTGIEEVEITESAVSGGTNVITFTYTNGESQTFNIKNGEAGKTQAAFAVVADALDKSGWDTAKCYLVLTETEGEFDVYSHENETWNKIDTIEIDLNNNVVQTTGQSASDVMSQKAVTDELNRIEALTPRQTTVLFQNSSSVEWLSGNIINGKIVTTYANKYFRFVIPNGVDYIEYERTTLDSGFNVDVFASANATTGYVQIVGYTQTYRKVDVSSYKYILLLCWDKPTLEQVQSINISITNTKLTTELGITNDYFDNTETNVPSMSIFSPMAKNVYVKKFVTNDGITWEQGGINGSTGAEETNAKAIRTKAIFLNGDNYAIASIDAIAGYNVAIAVYDEDGAYKTWQTTAFTNPYPNGYIRFVVWTQSGSGNILPSRGGETNALVIRHGELEYRVSMLEEHSALTYFYNPVIKADNPDPAVWYGEDGYWYLLATGLLSSKTMWRSTDLVNWENTGETPFTQDAITTWTGLGKTYFWAAEVVKVGNKWNLYLSAEQNPMYVFSSDHPSFGYEYVGVIADHVLGGSHENIDPCVRYDRDGSLWMFFDGATIGMYRVRLNEDGTSMIANTLEHVAGLPNSASGNTNREKTYEGAYLYRRKGYWYLIVSAGRYAYSDYCLRVGRSATLDGTFVDKEGNLMTEGNASLLMSSTGTFYGTGHNGSIITDKKGKTWMIFHSHWTGASSSSARPVCISEVLWDENGWPYFANNTLTVKGFGPTM